MSKLDALVYCAEDPYFSLSDSLQRLFTVIRTWDYAQVLLTGPQGSGKTSTVYSFAAQAELPLLKMNCPLVRETRDWFGYRTVANGTLAWEPSLFAAAVERGGVVILLDELSRSVPSVLNSLLPLMDHTKSSYIEELSRSINVGPNTYFFATANVGSQFTGTYRMDASLLSRFDIRICCDYLPWETEARVLEDRCGVDSTIATGLAKAAAEIRAANSLSGTLTETVSTRDLIAAATLFNQLGPDSFEYTLLPLFSTEGGANSDQAQVIQILQGQSFNVGEAGPRRRGARIGRRP